jgi:hypothetical protein
VQPFKNFPTFYGNPKVQYRVLKSPPLDPILSHINRIYTIPSYLRSIVILPPIYVLAFLIISFLLAFPSIFYKHFSSPPFVLHAPPISFFQLISRTIKFQDDFRKLGVISFVYYHINKEFHVLPASHLSTTTLLISHYLTGTLSEHCDL